MDRVETQQANQITLKASKEYKAQAPKHKQAQDVTQSITSAKVSHLKK